jgi:hypothetical protein
MKVNKYTDITDNTYTKQQVVSLLLNFPFLSFPGPWIRGTYFCFMCNAGGEDGG